MTNKASSFSAAPSIAPLHRHGGTVSSMQELAIHQMGNTFLVDGAGNVGQLPDWPKGPPVLLHFAGTPTFFNSSRLIMPGGQNFTFAAGDTAWALPLGDLNWRIVQISRANGLPVSPGGDSWTAYTPTITSQTGALTGATIVASGRYKLIAVKTVLLQVDVTLTAVGSGTPGGSLIATLPAGLTPSAFNFFGVSREHASTAKSGACLVAASGSTVSAIAADVSTYFANGNVVGMGVQYELA